MLSYPSCNIVCNFNAIAVLCSRARCIPSKMIELITIKLTRVALLSAEMRMRGHHLDQLGVFAGMGGQE